MAIVWEQRKLGELADIVGGGTPSTSKDEYWDGDIDWYAPAEIADQIYVESSERKITEEGFNNSSAKMLPVGTVLFTSRAGIGKMAILRKESCTNQGFQSIVPHENELDSYFIFSRSEELKRYGETVGAGSTFVEVSGKQMANMDLMMPPTIEEQRQIGGYFEKIDNLITLHQRKNALIFGKTAIVWEQRKLGDTVPVVTDYVAAGSFADIAANVEYKSEPDYAQLVRTVDLKHDFDNNDSVYVDKNAFEYLYRVNLDEESIVLPNIGANIGEVYYIEPSKLPYKRNVLGPNAIYLKPKENTKFIYTLFQTLDFQKKLAVSVASSGQPKFNKTELKDIRLTLPNSDEQHKIGEYFGQLDHLITLHQWKCSLKSNFPINVWEQRKLPEFVTFFNGQTYTPDDVQESGTLVLRSSNVKNGEIVDADNVYINPEIASADNVQEGDIIVVVRNGSRALIGKHAQIKDSKPNTVIGAFMSGMRSEHSSFVNALLDTSAFENEIAKNMGATINQITGYMFSKMEFMIPMDDEQEKIGEYFAKLDNLITLHQCKPFVLKYETDFVWEQRKLKDFGQATGGTSIESEFSEDGIYKVISIGSYSENSVYTDQGIRAIDSEKTRKRILNKGDLTMILNDKTASGNIIGRVLNIEESGVYVYNQRTERIEVDSSKYDSTFLYQMLNAPSIREKIIKQSQGNTQIYVVSA